MASGWRSTDNTSQSVRKVQCEPCAYKGTVKEARTYCRQCQEYMCRSCTSTHNSLKMCRHHECTTVTGNDLPLNEQPGISKAARSLGSKHVGRPSSSQSTGPESTSVYKPAQLLDSKHVHSVSATHSTDPEYGRKPVSNMEVVSSTVINVPCNNVRGSAVMPDGRIILADCENNRLILLNQDFTIQSMLELPGAPQDVAVYGYNAAVVTMPRKKQLQYVHVDSTLRAGNILLTGQLCWGVAVHGSEIYVGVHYDDRDDEDDYFHRIPLDIDGVRGVCQIRVLNIRGKVIRSIKLKRHNTYSNGITVGQDGTLYTLTKKGYQTCYTNAGYALYRVEHEGMSDVRGILQVDEDNLLVCCRDSDDIHILEKDGAHRIILSSANGVVRPQSVSYRRSDQTLIVTMSNIPSCRAYKLK